MGKYHRILEPGLNVLIPLLDKIKYVQYIPKEARGTLEDVVNQLYH